MAAVGRAKRRSGRLASTTLLPAGFFSGLLVTAMTSQSIAAVEPTLHGAASAENVSALRPADLAEVTAAQRGRIDPRAWGNASLRWLVDPGRVPAEQSSSTVRIGIGDVERFRTTVDMFDKLDGQFGGGHACEALIQYLSVDASRLLSGRFSEEVGRALFSAVGEATLLAAWMTYDSTPTSALAQGYFVQALAHNGSASTRPPRRREIMRPRFCRWAR